MAAAPGQLTLEQWKKRSNFLRALRWLTTNRDEDLTPEALIEQFTVYVQENARTGKVTAQMNHDVVFSEFVTSKYRDPNTPEWFWSHEKQLACASCVRSHTRRKAQNEIDTFHASVSLLRRLDSILSD